MKIIRKMFTAFTLLVLAPLAVAETWNISTLEWPPFSCKACPDQGAGIKALRDALKAEGIDVQFKFLPFERAIAEGAGDDFVGYYPAWPEDVVEGFSQSPVIFSSPVGFIEPKNQPLAWNTLADLVGKKIGIVNGYGNTQSFNEEVAAGRIKVESVVSDQQNVQKVAAGRLDGAFIDLANARWFLSNDQKDLAGSVTINPKVLEEKNLLIALNQKNQSKVSVLTEALKKVDTRAIVREYLARHLPSN
jgi:polar amino acid transport system substrate-binding protein